MTKDVESKFVRKKMMVYLNLQKIKSAYRNLSQDLRVFKEIGQTLPTKIMLKFGKT